MICGYLRGGTHSMKKRQKTIKHDFPMIELSLIAFMIFAIIITTIQILNGGEGYYFIYPISFLGLIFGIWLINYRNKKIEIRDSYLIISTYLGLKRKKYSRTDFKGYEIYETFDQTGLVKQIRLIDLNNKRIPFIRDSYRDYDKLIQLIKNYGIEYIGEKEIKWRFKKQYGLITSISFIIAMILFFLLKVI